MCWWNRLPWKSLNTECRGVGRVVVDPVGRRTRDRPQTPGTRRPRRRIDEEAQPRAGPEAVAEGGLHAHLFWSPGCQRLRLHLFVGVEGSASDLNARGRTCGARPAASRPERTSLPVSCRHEKKRLNLNSASASVSDSPHGRTSSIPGAKCVGSAHRSFTGEVRIGIEAKRRRHPQQGC